MKLAAQQLNCRLNELVQFDHMTPDPPPVSKFATALQNWCNSHPRISLREISLSSDVSNLHLYRKGERQITFEALKKLLPCIEKESTRLEAITLHLAYLADEVAPSYAADLRIEAVDASGQKQADIYDQIALHWAYRARTEPNFFAMWLGLDNFMHHPEREVVMFENPEEPAPTIERETEIAGTKVRIFQKSSYQPPAGQNQKVAEDTPAQQDLNSSISQAAAEIDAAAGKEPNEDREKSAG